MTLTAAAPAGAVGLVRMLARVALAVAIAFAAIGWASPRDAAAGPLPDGTTMQEGLAELGGSRARPSLA